MTRGTVPHRITSGDGIRRSARSVRPNSKNARAHGVWIPWKTAKNAVSHPLHTHQLTWLCPQNRRKRLIRGQASPFLGSYKNLAGVETQSRKTDVRTILSDVAAVINSLDENRMMAAPIR